MISRALTAWLSLLDFNEQNPKRGFIKLTCIFHVEAGPLDRALQTY
jgi:hypothetical protein